MFEEDATSVCGSNGQGTSDQAWEEDAASAYGGADTLVQRVRPPCHGRPHVFERKLLKLRGVRGNGLSQRVEQARNLAQHQHGGRGGGSDGGGGGGGVGGSGGHVGEGGQLAEPHLGDQTACSVIVSVFLGRGWAEHRHRGRGGDGGGGGGVRRRGSGVGGRAGGQV